MTSSRHVLTAQVLAWGAGPTASVGCEATVTTLSARIRPAPAEAEQTAR
jgi:hypothetical protein